MSKSARRRYVFARDEGICQLCWERVDWQLTQDHPLSATVDHIVPKRWGGSDAARNLRLAHKVCNNRRADPFVYRIGDQAGGGINEYDRAGITA